ncbi:MAG: sugar phosphate isomerase/epimerase family protein [Phycisphaeraceae bacterium]
MRLGMVAPLEHAHAMQQAGFDYLEVQIRSVLDGRLDDDAWRAGAPNPASLPLPLEAGAGLLPADMPVIGPERDLDALRLYMERVAARARALGIDVLVFGSGGARKRPDDVSPDAALRQLVEFCQLAGDACAAHDVTLVVEHLNRGETNTINTLVQERQLVEKAHHPRVAGLVDSYHFGVENDSSEDLLALAGRIAHVHLAEPSGRHEPGHPADAEQAFDFEDFFSLLHKIGYDGRFSIEGKLTGPIEEVAAPCLTNLRELWQAAATA